MTKISFSICRFPVMILIILYAHQSVYSQGTSRDSLLKKVDRKDIEKAINDINFGVPSSPAFELLPEKPSEVVHILSGRDIQTNLGTVFDGKQILGGAAFDVRPFVWFCRSLTSYNKSPLERVAWRSVFSIGTAVDPQNNEDVLISAGLRVPIIDNSDPRMNLIHLRKLDEAYQDYFNNSEQPPFDETPAEYKKRLEENVSGITDSIRKDWEADTWNAFKLEAGIAWMIRARGRSIKTDSLASDRLGFWLATAIPLADVGQLALSAKATWANTDDVFTEAARYSAGAGVRFFITTWLAGTLEGAQVWSKHEEGFSDLDDDWLHFALITEFKVPILNGWLGLTYGGDAGREANSDNKFAFTYTYYMNRLMSK